MAKLYYKYGTMFSGKSHEINSVVTSYEKTGKKYALGKPSTDTRDVGVKSRLGSSLICNFIINDNTPVNVALQPFTDYAVIVIDEAQFLTERQVLDLVDFVITHDVDVMAFGLKTDFMGHLFEGSATLLAHADAISEVKGVCGHPKCRRKSTMNLRRDSEGNVDLTGKQVSIGSDEYVALCHRHWTEARGPKDIQEPASPNAYECVEEPLC